MNERSPTQPALPDPAAGRRATRVSGRWPLVSGIAALVLAVGLGSLISIRDRGLPMSIDTAWMNEIIENRAPIWDFLSLGMNWLGGGIFATAILPVLILAALFLARRRWAAVYYLAATLVTTGLVQLLKNVFGRARPEDMLVHSDFGSFPSGHVANAAVMATTLAIVFWRLWVWIAGAVYVLVMMISRTYLGVHWLSDTIGGLLLGVGVAIVLWAPIAAKLDGERRRAMHHPVPDAASNGTASNDTSSG